jgi:hypothetical protein
MQQRIKVVGRKLDKNTTIQKAASMPRYLLKQAPVYAREKN